MDRKVFKKSDYQVGVNAPTPHTWCRSTTIPYFDDEFNREERAARNEEGKTYFVPADLTYREWYEQYVKASPGMLLQERIVRNRYADKQQLKE